ncbi:MAG: hypothetical protein M1500_00255 [Candidatus Marsarchaeota archaeon]|nr:hypothetical protein [Candidatus Marsarchaeota archaeon]MCL5112138.1 hypothetical protein [Candidatus Marsarchaeota archaeon]
MDADSGDRCVMCGAEKPGIPIREDVVFRAYRALIHASRTITGRGALNKRKFNLVVCREDYPKYKKLRNSYLRKEFTYVGIGVIFTALMMLVSPSKLLALAYGLVLILFLYILAQISYMPALDIHEEHGKARDSASRTATRVPSAGIGTEKARSVRRRKARSKSARK